MPWPDQPNPRAGRIVLIAAAILALGMLAVALPLCSHAGALPLCGVEKRVSCVVDGDTLWLEGQKIRIENIDAPELHGRCAAERKLARQARDRLAALIVDTAPVVTPAGHDLYGRELALIAIAGQDVGTELVAEGLARPWTGYRKGWCRRR